MRLGCVGCLLLVVVILVVLVGALGLVFLSGNIFGAPDGKPVSFTKSDGYAAQQRLLELVLRQSGQSSRRNPIVVTEPEANAFLARHLEQAGLPLSPIIVRFSAGQLTVQGQTLLRNLFKSPPLSFLISWVSDKRLDQPVWVTVRGRIAVAGTGKDRHGNLDVDEFALGRQSLATFLLPVFLGPGGGGLLTWPMPGVVDDVRIGEGQIVITTR